MDLSQSDSAVADASGTATVTLTPLRAFEVWDIERMHVQSTSNVNIPEIRVYKGFVDVSSIIDSSYVGTLNNSELPRVQTIQNGEAVIAQWTGCDVGAQCTFNVYGKVRGR